ncbi:MAG: acyl-ACP--UDP-N-acetylglucosamine O-acyltransferase [Cytophagales bacterium]|nr:acyl-ACP--UDP-N-acetylglucosamine O-acyltransferase [Cytophagales bacterium]
MGDSRIDPRAVVSPEAVLGSDVEIGPYAVVHANVEIGEGTVIYSHAVIREGARIGRNCKIYNGAILSCDPQDPKFKGEDSRLYVGDGCSIGEYATLSKGTLAGGSQETRIGKDCLIMSLAHVGHDCIIGDRCTLTNGVQVAGHVVIGDESFLGGLVGISQRTIIGRNVIIGGLSKISKHVPPYTRVAAKWDIRFYEVNVMGLKMRDFPAERIEEIRDAYRLLFKKGLLKKERFEAVRGMKDFPEKKVILDFFEEIGSQPVVQPF